MLWVLIAPQRFGLPELTATQMLERHIDAQRQLRRMFPEKGDSRYGSYLHRQKCATIYKRAIDALRSAKDMPDIFGGQDSD